MLIRETQNSIALSTFTYSGFGWRGTSVVISKKYNFAYKNISEMIERCEESNDVDMELEGKSEGN